MLLRQLFTEYWYSAAQVTPASTTLVFQIYSTFLSPSGNFGCWIIAGQSTSQLLDDPDRARGSLPCG